MVEHMRKKSCLAGGLAACACLFLAAVRAAEVEAVGKVKVEVYTRGGFSGNNGNLGGTAIPDLTGAASYPNAPTAIVYAPIAEYPFNENPDALTGDFRAGPASEVYDNYGVRMSGFLRPPVSGTWYFYLASDDNGQLWISPDESPANKVLVAREDAWGDRRYYFNIERAFPGLPDSLVGKGGNRRDDGQTGSITADGRYQTSNVSDGIVMIAGRKYYFEALMKEGTGADNLSIWATQNKNPIATLATDFPDYPDPDVVTGGPAPLSGDWISVIAPEETILTQQPLSRTNVVGTGFRFEVKVVPGITAGKLSYKWFQNDVEVLNKTGGSVDSPVLDSIALGYDPVRLAELGDNNSAWTVVITPKNGPALTSTAAQLVVVPDDIPPRLGRATPSDLRQTITLMFDSPMAPFGVIPENFVVEGLTVDSATLLNPSLVQNSVVRLHVSPPYAEGADVTLTVKPGLTDLAGNATAPEVFTFRSYSRLPGVVSYVRFENESGPSDPLELLAFRDGARVASDAPDEAQILRRFASLPTSPNVDNFVGLIRGWVTPPETGDYEFFIASDEGGLFWLSTDDTPGNLKAIAYEPGFAAFGDFLGTTQGAARDRIILSGDADAKPANIGKLRNRSGVYPGSEWPGAPGPIRLDAGQKYYAVALHREIAGNDGLAIGVKKYGELDSTVQILSGNWMEGYGDPTQVPPISLVLTIGATAEGKVRMEWAGNARLYSSEAVDGTYIEVPGASSGFSPTASLAARYFRLRP